MTKRTFFFLLTIAIFALIVASCEKDSDNGDTSYQFKANFDGTEKVFSVLTSATKGSDNNGLFNLSLIGIGATESISMSLWSYADDFTAGKTFTSDGIEGKENVMAFGPNGSTDSTASYYSFYIYGTVIKQLNCTITETSSEGIKGTFSGIVYKNQPDTLQKIEITDGTFYASFP